MNNTTPKNARKVLIVGAGAAGLSTALQLRQLDQESQITILGAENELPYDRPPLSKGVLQGKAAKGDLALTTHTELHDLRISLETGSEVVELLKSKKQVRLKDNRLFDYDTLVVATGTSPRWPAEAKDIRGTYVLKDVEDAFRLQQHIQPGQSLVVVGAGFIGLEVAAVAVQQGVDVSIVEPMEVPLGNRLTETVGRWLVAEHEKHGVKFHLGKLVDDYLIEDGAITGVRLTSGETLDADVVLVCVGTTPNVAWLEDSGLTLDNGVVTDEYGAAANDVYAVGDVANFFHPVLGTHVRLEHRTNANEQAVVVARNIVGETTPYSPLPFFWTDQYDTKLQLYGSLAPGLTAEFELGQPGDAKWILVFRDANSGEFRAVLSRNAVKETLPFRREAMDYFSAKANV